MFGVVEYVQKQGRIRVDENLVLCFIIFIELSISLRHLEIQLEIGKEGIEQ